MIAFIKAEKELLTLGVTLIASVILKWHPSISFPEPNAFTIAMSAVIFAAIIYSATGVVRHAERLSFMLGEPFGTLLLTLTAISVEVIMVATMMFHGDPDPGLGRDTIYCTIMILINGLLGLSMLLGGLKYGEQAFNIKSASSFFSMIIALVGIGMILPNEVAADRNTVYQVFSILFCITLYAIFLRMQTKNHSDFFVFGSAEAKEEHESAGRGALYHGVFLALTIAGISLLAEYFSEVVDNSIDALKLPSQIAPILIAAVIVSPEGLTAIKAGLQNDFQRALNIILGSALSTIALTVPVVLIMGLATHREIFMELDGWRASLLMITILVGMESSKDGRSNELQGFIHFSLFIGFLAGELL